MMPIGELKRHTLAVAIATALLSMAMPALASERKLPDRQVTRLVYDWLKPVQTVTAHSRLSVRERKRMAALMVRYGNGSYICSPSGFGKKSQCYSR